METERMIEDTIPPQVKQKTLNGTTRNVMMVDPPYLLLPLSAWIILCFYDQSDFKMTLGRIQLVHNHLYWSRLDVKPMPFNKFHIQRSL